MDSDPSSEDEQVILMFLPVGLWCARHVVSENYDGSGVQDETLVDYL